MRYRKRPVEVEVEAEQWKSYRLQPPVPPQFLRWVKMIRQWEVQTLHGWVPIRPYEWIAHNDEEAWPIAPHVFDATYEPIPEETNQLEEGE